MSSPLTSHDSQLPRSGRLLVTGGAGFIGSNLVRHLLTQTSHEVLNLDKLTYAGNLESLADLADHPRYQFAQVDLCDAEAVDEVVQRYRPDAVMHLAADSHVDRSIDAPGDFIQTNVVGTYNLLQASLRHYRQLKSPLPQNVRANDAATSLNADANILGEGVRGRGQEKTTNNDQPTTNFRFLHVSTDEVYGSLGPDGKFTEETRYDPHSPYSASKASSDHLARAWSDTYGLPVMVTNCSNNYGPYQFPEKLIPVVILKCLRGEPIPVYGKGENIRDWLYVEDHCRALLAVAERGRPGETYNIGGNNEQTNLDLVRMLCGLLDELSPCGSGKPHAEKITFVKDRPGHDLRYAIDAGKIERELGWTPQEDFESGFRKTVQWYLKNQSWWQNILSGDYKLERIGEGSG